MSSTKLYDFLNQNNWWKSAKSQKQFGGNRQK